MMVVTSRIGVLCVATAGVLLCGAGLFYPAPKVEKPMAMAIGVWPGCESLIILRQRGLIKKRTINYVEMSWSSAAMVAFEKRVVDAAVVTLDELLRLSVGGQSPKAVLVLGVSKGADAIMAQPEIQTLADLRGRRVGLEMRGPGEYLLARALKDVGMTLSDVEIVPLNLAETESAYEDKDLDAVVTSDPWRVRLQKKGAHVLFDSQGLGNEMTRVLVIREDAMANFHSAIKDLVNAHFKIDAMPEAQGYTDDEISVILRREGVTLKMHEDSMSMIQMPSRADNYKLLATGEQSLTPVIERMASFMAKNGLLQGESRINGLLDPSLVKEGE